MFATEVLMPVRLVIAKARTQTRDGSASVLNLKRMARATEVLVLPVSRLYASLHECRYVMALCQSPSESVQAYICLQQSFGLLLHCRAAAFKHSFGAFVFACCAHWRVCACMLRLLMGAELFVSLRSQRVPLCLAYWPLDAMD